MAGEINPCYAPAEKTLGQSQLHPTLRHLWVVFGPSGCGKSTVAQHLAGNFRVDYIEGDDYHPDPNITKMISNHPLTDNDRWDWLISLRERAVLALGSSSSVVLTCSALKHRYRDVIRIAGYGSSAVRIHFLYLRVDVGTLYQRVTARKGHFMAADMIQSQIQDLEEPYGEWDVIEVDGNATPTVLRQVVEEIVLNKADSNT